MKIILDSQHSKHPSAKCKGICQYWILTLRNDHIWIGKLCYIYYVCCLHFCYVRLLLVLKIKGICCRNQGTHYSHNQRISVLMVRSVKQ